MSAHLDELKVRRHLKKYGTEEPRVHLNAYGDKGYILIDCSAQHAQDLRDELTRVLSGA